MGYVTSQLILILARLRLIHGSIKLQVVTVPSIIDGKYLVTDTYPDKYGFQRLYAINILNKKYNVFLSTITHSLIETNVVVIFTKVSNVTSPIYIDLISKTKETCIS